MAAINQNFPVSVTLQQMVNDPNIVDDGSGPPVAELIVDTYERIEDRVIESILKRLPRINKITLTKPTDRSYHEDIGSMVTQQVRLKTFAAEVLKSNLTLTNLSMSKFGTSYFMGCIDELVTGKCISSLSMELDDYTRPSQTDMESFRAFLTKEDCPVTDLTIVIPGELTLDIFISWFDSSGPPNQTRIKHLTLEQSKETQYALERFSWDLGARKTSTLKSNVRELTLKGFYLNESMRRSLTQYLLCQECKPLVAVCLVNFCSVSDPPEQDMDGTARVVQQIEEFVKSRKWCRNTYKAISTSNQQATQHAYLLVKWVSWLSGCRNILMFKCVCLPMLPTSVNRS